MVVKYVSQIDGRVVELLWLDNVPVPEQVKKAFGAELYDYGEDWLSVFREGHEEVFVIHPKEKMNRE